MSAYICGPDLFKAIVVFATKQDGSRFRVDPRYVKGITVSEKIKRVELANVYADLLYQENVRSVQHRYPNDSRDNLPGPVDDPGHVTLTHKDFFDPAYHALQPVAILKMLDCLEYQSCETDDYESTTAHRLLVAIRGAAITYLPGYEEAPWDYYAERKAA